MKALECSLLKRSHELLPFIPFKPASPTPEKIPLRGDGGRVGDFGLALDGDFWLGPGNPSGSHFRAYGDDLRGPLG